jgi:hypothetical protein
MYESIGYLKKIIPEKEVALNKDTMQRIKPDLFGWIRGYKIDLLLTFLCS